MKNSPVWKIKVESALHVFLTEEERQNKVVVKHHISEMKRCYKLSRINPEEYFLYELDNKPDNIVKSYLSDYRLFTSLAETGKQGVHNIELHDKYHFYELLSEYFHRSACVVAPNTDCYPLFESVVLKEQDVIAKPNSDGYGNGVFFATVENTEDAKLLFDKLKMQGGTWVVEGKIRQSDIMSSWNKTSVNTIRISSFLNSRGFFIVYPFIRSGRKGSIVDNGGQGGIFAVIDGKNGRICTDGKDEKGKTYKQHPDSHITYRGWQVPEWEKLIAIVKEIHTTKMAHHPYIGWDFAHTDKGWVLIEGNWGQFICQQACLNKGLRQEFLELIKP